MGLGWAEVGVLLLLTLFVVGPERLPSVARDAGKALRSLRTMVKGLTDDLKTELGPEVGDLDLASFHPRTFVQKHLFSDDEDEARPRTRPRDGAPLVSGEPAPWDPDAT